MAIPHANPGDVVDVRPLASALAASTTSTLLKTENIEVIRLVMTARRLPNTKLVARARCNVWMGRSP